jgi:hypothetical protein
MTQEGLESKRETLDELERSETEARRLEAALGRGRANGIRSPSQEGDHMNEERQGAGGEVPEGPSSHLPPHPGPNPVRRRTKAPGMGLLSALSYTLHGMMDVDPETARRNGITKTRESISQVRIFQMFRFLSAIRIIFAPMIAGGCSSFIGSRSQVFQLNHSSRPGSLSAAKSCRFKGDDNRHGQKPSRLVQEGMVGCSVVYFLKLTGLCTVRTSRLGKRRRRK